MRWWDLPAVDALEQQLFAPESWSAELFWSELAQGSDRLYLVAESDEAVVGYAGLAVGPDEAYVQTLGTASAAQGHGVGTALLTALLAEARRRGLPQVGLEVRVANVAAQSLYRRFGFEVLGVRRGYYLPSGDDALVMMAAL